MESSYAVLLMVRGHIPGVYMCVLLAEVFLLCYLMGEVREVQLHSERSEYWLLVSALAPSGILRLGTL